jgi:crotonobetaine/carnitine-CoA ligase
MTPLEVLRRYPPHDGTLWAMLASRAAARPAHPFVVDRGASLGYAELMARAGRASAMFAARGVQAGDRVGVMALNHASTVVAWFALARLGAIMVPVNPDFGRAEAGYVFAHAQVAGVLCSPEALEVVRAACAAVSPAPWLLLNSPGGQDAPASFDAALQETSAAAPDTPASADSTCLFVYTSGTTGSPKGVMHSQRNVLLAGEGFVARMHLQPEERLLCILPLFHVNALLYSLAGALAAGATLILEPRFSASTFWRTVNDTGATEVNTIAAVSHILIRRPRSEFVAGHALRKIYGAPLTAEIYRVFQQEFGVPHLIEGYGMSEIPGVLNNPFDGERKAGSMGRPSVHPDPELRFAEMKVADDAGREVAAGEVGELVVRTPIVMQGYFRDPEQTRAAFRDGWFLTGDLGRRDADGYFWFVARKKDIIRRRGENISGAELDRVVGEHPDVLEAAAIAVPSELGEDEILVAVVPRPNAAPSAEQIGRWCRDRLAPSKVPRYVAFVDSLPHTPTHRVAKFKLREDEALRARAVDLAPPRAPGTTR